MNYKSAIYTIPQNSRMYFWVHGKGVSMLQNRREPWIGWPKRRSIMTSSDNTCLCCCESRWPAVASLLLQATHLRLELVPWNGMRIRSCTFLASSTVTAPCSASSKCHKSFAKISALMLKPLGLLSVDIQDVSQQHGPLATHSYNVRPPNDSKVGL